MYSRRTDLTGTRAWVFRRSQSKYSKNLPRALAGAVLAYECVPDRDSLAWYANRKTDSRRWVLKKKSKKRIILSCVSTAAKINETITRPFYNEDIFMKIHVLFSLIDLPRKWIVSVIWTNEWVFNNLVVKQSFLHEEAKIILIKKWVCSKVMAYLF